MNSKENNGISVGLTVPSSACPKSKQTNGAMDRSNTTMAFSSMDGSPSPTPAIREKNNNTCSYKKRGRPVLSDHPVSEKQEVAAPAPLNATPAHKRHRSESAPPTHHQVPRASTDLRTADNHLVSTPHSRSGQVQQSVPAPSKCGPTLPLSISDLPSLFSDPLPPDSHKCRILEPPFPRPANIKNEEKIRKLCTGIDAMNARLHADFESIVQIPGTPLLHVVNTQKPIGCSPEGEVLGGVMANYETESYSTGFRPDAHIFSAGTFRVVHSDRNDLIATTPSMLDKAMLPAGGVGATVSCDFCPVSMEYVRGKGKSLADYYDKENLAKVERANKKRLRMLAKLLLEAFGPNRLFVASKHAALGLRKILGDKLFEDVVFFLELPTGEKRFNSWHVCNFYHKEKMKNPRTPIHAVEIDMMLSKFCGKEIRFFQDFLGGVSLSPDMLQLIKQRDKQAGEKRSKLYWQAVAAEKAGSPTSPQKLRLENKRQGAERGGITNSTRYNEALAAEKAGSPTSPQKLRLENKRQAVEKTTTRYNEALAAEKAGNPTSPQKLRLENKRQRDEQAGITNSTRYNEAVAAERAGNPTSPQKLRLENKRQGDEQAGITQSRRSAWVVYHMDQANEYQRQLQQQQQTSEQAQSLAALVAYHKAKAASYQQHLQRRKQQELHPELVQQLLRSKQQQHQHRQQQLARRQQLAVDPLIKDSELVLVEDYGLVDDPYFYAMAQMKPCTLTPADRVGANKSLALGVVGMCCKHCGGCQNYGRYFPRSIAQLGSIIKNQILKHAMHCKASPPDVRNTISSSVVPRPAAQTRFSERVFTRLNEWRVQQGTK